MNKKMRIRPGAVAILVLTVMIMAGCMRPSSTPNDGHDTGSEQLTQAPEKDKEQDAKPTDKPQPTQADRKKDDTKAQPTQKPSPTPYVAQMTVEEARAYADSYHVSYDYSGAETDLGLTFNADGTYQFDQENTLYSKDIKLTIKAPSGAQVYYTLNGKNPTKSDKLYTGTITFAAKGSSFPDAYTLRVRAFYKNGESSAVAARTYLVGTKLNGRFSTLIFSISGDPDELTNGPDGIFYGNNYEQRGRESEREIHLDAWRANGKSILDQFAGVRIYGGYSRQSPLKSMKLFARKSYDADNKNFKLKDFGTPRLDGSDSIIKSYDKLVLRNCGNDMQFSFIRDELSQTLCKIAGFECYEEVLPAVVYLNGSYYNYCWLHENYSNKYLKEKYGDDAPGEFFILEGEEKKKYNDDDPETQKLVEEYNRTYDQLIKLDMTKDANYAKLTEFMDVESYLDFYAWNIAINNWDWPNNNYKCFKYVPAEGDTYTEGVFDGRWRFLVHDMDYTYGLYDQDKAMANYNTLRVVLEPNHDTTRYSPLFALLMKREDCKKYFKDKTYEFINGALSPDTIKTTYYLLHATRKQELEYYYDYLLKLNRQGNFAIWSQEGHYDGYERQILNFADQRAKYVARYMEELLP